MIENSNSCNIKSDHLEEEVTSNKPEHKDVDEDDADFPEFIIEINTHNATINNNISGLGKRNTIANSSVALMCIVILLMTRIVLSIMSL